MKELSQKEKEKIISRIYWDMDVEFSDLDALLRKDIDELDSIEYVNFYRRLLSSCDWYTLLKIVPIEKLLKILNDNVLNRLYPKELKSRYLYAREILSG